MVPLLSTLVAALLLVCPGSRANSSYEPYIDAAELYRMQLLANAFQYPGDKLGVDGLGGGVMDVPYGLMGDGRASDRLVDFEDETGPAYWPEELVAELAAATENGEGADSEEDEEVMQPAPIEMAEEKEKQIAEEKEKEEKPEKSQDLKDATKHSGAQLRDQEHLEHSALHGFQSVSGGTVNGQNKQIKTDKALPAYCNPPNPCPVGKTAEDNCVENFVNSAENNQILLSHQECPCDTEHMFTCPEGSQTVSSKAQGSTSGDAPSSAAAASQQMQLNKVIAELSNMEKEEISEENKRFTLVAKKSPHLIRKRSEVPDSRNPYLEGDKINIAAKKDPNLAKNSMYRWRTV